MRETRPNILLILTDQQRYDSLGCYGMPGVHTPNLDRLARHGALFQRCYANNPVCTPSRASLWTGKHLPGHGVYRLHDCLPQDEVLFSDRLRDAGYDTALFGKLHVSGHVWEIDRRHPHDGFRVYEWVPDPHGFGGCKTAYKDWLAARHPDVLERLETHGSKPGHLPLEAHMTTWAADRTIDYLARERRMDRPFLCCMSIFDPHDPYCNYPVEMGELVSAPELPDMCGLDEPFERRPITHLVEGEHGFYGSAEAFSADEIRRWRHGYHAAIALIDMQVGRVLESLDRSGLGENTLVLFTSDHGDMLGDHGLLGKGCFFYDPCTRVPLIVRAPGRGLEGRRIASLCQPHDVAATCLLAAGFGEDDVRAWMPDSVDLLRPEGLEDRGYVACLFRNSGLAVDHEAGRKYYHDPPLHGTMWVEGRYKLNVYHSPTAVGTHPPGELFDLEADPLELSNLWNDPAHREARDRLALRMLDWLAEQDFKGRGGGENAMPDDPGYHRMGLPR